MFVFPRTVAFKTPSNLIFRRYHGVATFALVGDYYQATKANGAFLLIPKAGTTVLVGKSVKVADK